MCSNTDQVCTTFIVTVLNAFSGFLLTCISHAARVIDIGWTSVCPSVTHWYCVETAQPIIKLSSVPGSLMMRTILFLEFQWEHPNRGVKCNGVGKKLQFPTIYLAING